MALVNNQVVIIMIEQYFSASKTHICCMHLFQVSKCVTNKRKQPHRQKLIPNKAVSQHHLLSNRVVGGVNLVSKIVIITAIVYLLKEMNVYSLNCITKSLLNELLFLL